MKCRALLALLPLLVLPAAVATETHLGRNILFIVDGSNSMWGQIEGQTKIEIVQQVWKAHCQSEQLGFCFCFEPVEPL